MVPLFESGYINQTQYQLVRKGLKSLLKLVRP